MRHLSYIVAFAFSVLCLSTYAQTPYDSFAPETSRPMLGIAEQEVQRDSILCVIVVTPLANNVRKWLSVDPMADKYPNISPYAYCEWNPVRFVDPDGRNPRTGVPGKEMKGVWMSAQNTTYIEGRTSFSPIQLPQVEYFNRLASINPGTLQPTFTKEKYLLNIPEQDVALITNPAIQIAASAVLGTGISAIGSEIAPVVMNMSTDISTYINASLYPAFENSIPMQVGAGVIEGFIKGVTPGTELTPNMYSSPAYQTGSEIGNSSVYIMKELNDYFKNWNQLDNEGQ